MNDEKLKEKIFRILEGNYEFLVECGQEAILAINKLLAQMQYYHSLQIFYESLNEEDNKQTDRS